MTRLKEFFGQKQNIAGTLLVSIPLLTYWVYWTLHPSYWFNGDPAAFYFIDSLSIFIGKPYVYVDHPGTPMQVIGSLLLALTYPFLGGTQNFIEFYIARPEAFFLMTHVFLLGMNLIAALVFFDTARTSLKSDQVLGAVALTLLYFALHPHAFPSLTFWSHNSFNFPFGTLWFIWLYREVRQEKQLEHWRLIALGFAAGVLAIAQVYFWVWVLTGVLTVFIFTLKLTRSAKQSIAATSYISLGSVLGAISMLIPIYREIPRFVDWMLHVTTHKGLYGTGESGILTIEMLLTSIGYWWTSLRPMMLLLILCLLGLGIFTALTMRRTMTISPGNFAMLAGLLVHTSLIMVMLVKTAGKLRYSLSLAATLPVLVLVVVVVAGYLLQGKTRPLVLLYALMLIGVGLSLFKEINLAQRRFYVEQDARLAKTQAVSRIAKTLGVEKREVVIVYAYGVPLQCSGMLEASGWTGAFQKEIAAICHNQYAIFDTEVALNSAVELVQIQDIDWDLVIWPGNGSDLPQYLASVNAVNIPKSWRVRRAPWFFIHSDVLQP